MSFCRKCGFRVEDGDAFCSKCGTKLTTESIQSASSTRRQRGSYHDDNSRKSIVPAMQTTEGRARFEAIEKKYDTRRNVYYSIAIICVILACVIAYQFQGELLWILPVIIGIIAILIASNLGWTEADYYSIPGSKDSNGEHRCIHCGHRGIYRHGEYKTNNEHAKCSKCKEHLWTN